MYFCAVCHLFRLLRFQTFNSSMTNSVPTRLGRISVSTGVDWSVPNSEDRSLHSYRLSFNLLGLFLVQGFPITVYDTSQKNDSRRCDGDDDNELQAVFKCHVLPEYQHGKCYYIWIRRPDVTANRPCTLKSLMFPPDLEMFTGRDQIQVLVPASHFTFRSQIILAYSQIHRRLSHVFSRALFGL